VSDSKAAWFSGWGTLISAIAGVVVAVVAVLTYAHTQGQSSQSFSVALDSQQEQGVPGHGADKSLNFTIKHCDVGAKEVSCVLTVLSPRYDHRLEIFPLHSSLTDADGDRFQGTRDAWYIQLERDQPSTFKMVFQVNKSIVLPATVQMVFYVDGFRHEKTFPLK
jgi:hypothetical protein